MVKEARMIPQLSRRIAGLALRMVAVALSMATLALRIMIVSWMIVEWPPRIAMINHANVNDADIRGLADVRCNCWPFVQTSLSARSTAMTSNKEGMIDLVPIGPREVLMAYGCFSLEVYADNESDATIIADWDVSGDVEIKEYTQSICAGPGYEFEIIYLVIPKAIEANVEVKLKLKDLGSRSRAVYGKIKASTTDYRNKSVHLFSYERGTSLSFPSGSTSILPLSPSMVAVPCRWELELHIEVDLTVITTCDSQEEEQDKNLKFSLEFNHEITSQEREVDDDQVEVNIKWYRIC